MHSITLEYKREWISKQIHSGGPQGQLHLVINRDRLLDGLCDRLGQASESLRNGIDVRFGNGWSPP